MAQEHPARSLFEDVFARRISRRELLQRGAAIGLSAPVIAALANLAPIEALAAKEGELAVTYYDWIVQLHSPIDQVNADFKKSYPLSAQVAPSQDFGVDRFVTEAKQQTSTWDMYIGTTPFLEMISLAESGTIEPWDPYIPADVLNDLPPAMKAEGSYNGKLYVWPFLLDVIVQGWNAEQVKKAGLDPEAPPRTWDEFLANSKKVKDSGAAQFGCTFDAHAWRSLLPITHSIDTNVYNEDGTFMWNSDAAVQALEIMKQMFEMANPDDTNPGTSDGGVNGTPDEGAFAAQRACYYVKYENSHLRFAGTWPDPTQLRLAALPKTANGAGGTVFWNTGAALFKYGKNKTQAAEYMKALCYDPRIWKHSFNGDPAKKETPVGQMPDYNSLWASWKTDKTPWVPSWAFDIWDHMSSAKAIVPTKLSVTQFNVAQPFYVKYLKGETKDAKAALTQANDAVQAALKKANS